MPASFLKTWNLRTKLMIILILFILSPLMLFGILFYQSSTDLVSQRTDKEGIQVLTLVNQNVSQLLKGFEAQLSDIYEQEAIMTQLSDIQKQPSSELVSTNDDSVNRYLRDFLRGKDELDSIYLFTPKATYFGDFKGSTFFSEIYELSPTWNQFISFGAGRVVWLPTYEMPPNQYISKPSHYFALGMQVKDVYDSLQPLGTLIANVKIEALDNIISNVQVSPNSFVFITDPKGNLIWNRNTEAYGIQLGEYSFFQNLDRHNEGKFIEKINGITYQGAFVRSAYNGWYYFSFVPQSDLNAQTKDLKAFLGATIIAFAALFILLAVLTSNFITRPIRQMAIAMKQIDKDNFEPTLSVQTSDEMSMLLAAFVSMRRKINDLIKEVRIISNKEKEAEIRALQAQINPHFVYNSLDAINWLAIENDQNRISQMITSLSDIMRYAIKPGKPLVTLEEELKWAKNYAYLQEMRFEDKFEVFFDIQISDLQLHVPRLLFQPYLENSVIHGMEEIDEGGIIRITINMINVDETDKLQVIIEDNGSGITANKLQQIKDRSSHGIGIYNLDERLKMEYGVGYGTTIESIYGEGTTVTIVLPYIR